MELAMRIEVNVLCLAVLAVIAFGLDRRRSERRSPDFRLFGAMLLSTAAMLVLDTGTWILDGTPGATGRWAVLSVNALYYLVHTVPVSLFLVYTDLQIHRDASRLGMYRAPLLALLGVIGAAALATPFTGWLFTVDPTNHYVRGPAYPVFAVFSYGLGVIAILVVIWNRQRLTRRVFWTLLSYPLPSLVGSFVQMLAYGLVLVWPTTTMFLLVAWTNIQRRSAATDHLTGLANRRRLDEELEYRVGRGLPIGGLLLDLNDFKAINDTFGHEEGDRALEEAAALLHSAVRRDDVVARFGGDEFVILLAGPTDLAEVTARLREVFARHNSGSGKPYRLSFSMGSAFYDTSVDAGPAQFLARLDAQMYAQKAGWRSASRPFDARAEDDAVNLHRA